MKYFELWELVPQKTYETFGDKAWSFFHPKALEMLDGAREFLGVPLIVNNWHSGGQRQYSGWRPEDCPLGAKHSQHKLGNAFDPLPQGMTADEARKRILADQDNPLLLNITRMETGVAWVHMDAMVLPAGLKRIHVFADV